MKKKTILVGLMTCLTVPLAAQSLSIGWRRVAPSLESRVAEEGIATAVVESATEAAERALVANTAQLKTQAESAQLMRTLLSNPPQGTQVRVPISLANPAVPQTSVVINRAPIGFTNPIKIDAVKRIASAGFVPLERKAALLQAGKISLSPNGIDVVLDEKTYQKYRRSHLSLFGMLFRRGKKEVRQQDYENYVNVVKEFNEFAADLEKFQAQQTRRIENGEDWASLWEVDAFQERFDKVAQQIKDESQNFIGVLPPDFLQKSQYLQRAQYYLTTLRGGELPEKLPAPIIPLRRIEVSNFYLTGDHLLMDPFAPSQAPQNLRIAVVHEKKKIHDIIKGGANSKYAVGWTVDSFATPEEFLAQKDYFLYDVVFGDFDPYGNSNSYLLEKLVEKGKGGIVILSVCDRNPDRWSSPDMEESHRDWVAFAKVSMQLGIDGNLGVFFPEENLTPKRVFRKIRDAYAAKGGIWEWTSEESLYGGEYYSRIQPKF